MRLHIKYFTLFYALLVFYQSIQCFKPYKYPLPPRALFPSLSLSSVLLLLTPSLVSSCVIDRRFCGTPRYHWCSTSCQSLSLRAWTDLELLSHTEVLTDRGLCYSFQTNPESVFSYRELSGSGNICHCLIKLQLTPADWIIWSKTGWLSNQGLTRNHWMSNDLSVSHLTLWSPVKTNFSVCFPQLADSIALYVQEMFQSTRDHARGLEKKNF